MIVLACFLVAGFLCYFAQRYADGTGLDDVLEEKYPRLSKWSPILADFLFTVVLAMAITKYGGIVSSNKFLSSAPISAFVAVIVMLVFLFMVELPVISWHPLSRMILRQIVYRLLLLIATFLAVVAAMSL